MQQKLLQKPDFSVCLSGLRNRVSSVIFLWCSKS